MDRRETIARNIERLMGEANERRKAQGLDPWSRRSLSIAAGNQNLIPDIVTRGRSPTDRSLSRLAEVLECRVEDITGEYVDPLVSKITDRARDASPEQRKAILAYIDLLKSQDRAS